MKKEKKGLSTLQSGVLLIIYIALCLFLFFLNTNFEVSKTVKTNLTNNINLKAKNIEKLIEQQVDSMEALADYIARQPVLINETIIEFMDATINNSFLSRIYVIDETGLAYFNSGNTIDVSDREYFKRAMGGETTIAQPVKYILEDKYRIIMAVPIIYNGVAEGVLGASFELSDLDKVLFYNYEYQQIGYSFVMNSDGDLISIEEDKADIGEEDFFSFFGNATFDGYTLDEVSEVLRNDEATCLKVNRNDDERYMAIAPLDFNDWLLVYIIPATVAEDEYAFIADNEIILFLEIASGFVIYLLYIISRNKKQRKQLLKRAEIDQLTGFYNKISMQRMVQDRIAKNEDIALLLIDLDDFKHVNDNYGHFVGDEVLTRISQCVRNALRKDDVIGRVGGDEIMVMIKNIDDIKVVEEKCKELIKRISGIEFEPGFSIGCSIGVAFYPQDADNFSDLYKRVDEALYEAKAAGKRNYHFYHK